MHGFKNQGPACTESQWKMEGEERLLLLHNYLDFYYCTTWNFIWAFIITQFGILLGLLLLYNSEFLHLRTWKDGLPGYNPYEVIITL